MTKILEPERDEFRSSHPRDDAISSFFNGRYSSVRAISDLTSLLLALRKMQGDAHLLFNSHMGEFDLITASLIANPSHSYVDLAQVYIDARGTLIRLCQEAQIDPAKLYKLPPPKAARLIHV